MKRLAVVACLALMPGLASHPAAQSPAGLAFEVVSVKPTHPDGAGPPGLPALPVIRTTGNRFIASNATLRDLVKRAYGYYFESQLDGGPDWQTSRRFDIQATAAGPTASMDDMLPMLKALLADRFLLKVHVETRDLPIYALVVARDDRRLGANITTSTLDCAKARQEQAALIASAPGAVAARLQAGQGLPCAIMPVPAREAGAMTMRGHGVTMGELASFLVPASGRMVQDRTGLSGLHDWELTYDRGPRPAAAGTPSPSPGSPPLMVALEEQLGLKLESARGPVDVLVIDSAALPQPD